MPQGILSVLRNYFSIVPTQEKPILGHDGPKQWWVTKEEGPANELEMFESHHLYHLSVDFPTHLLVSDF